MIGLKSDPAPAGGAFPDKVVVRIPSEFYRASYLGTVTMQSLDKVLLVLLNRTAEDLERYSCTLLDQDPYALGIARGTVARIEAALGGKIQVRYVEDSVRTMLRTRVVQVFDRE